MRKPKRMTPIIYVGPGLRLARPVIAEAGVKSARTKNYGNSTLRVLR
jgi:hypothetical protein